MDILDAPDVKPVHAAGIELMREVPFDLLTPLPLHPLASLAPIALFSETLIQPGAGHPPVPIDGPWSNTQQRGNFIFAEPGEVTHLHYLTLTRAHLTQP